MSNITTTNKTDLQVAIEQWENNQQAINKKMDEITNLLNNSRADVTNLPTLVEDVEPLTKAWGQMKKEIDARIEEIGYFEMLEYINTPENNNGVSIYDYILNYITPSYDLITKDYTVLPTYINDPLFAIHLDEFDHSAFAGVTNLYEIIRKQAINVLNSLADDHIINYISEM